MSDDELVKHMTGLITAGLDRVEQLKAQNLRLSGMCYDLNAEIELLREALIEERTEILWSAYNTGLVRDGRWTHMFMSDGEWLASECGLDPSEADYPDDVVRDAIPIAAGRVLLRGESHD